MSSTTPVSPGPARARVGIVLPSFNRAKLLPAAVASMMAQDFTDWELVIVDDNSTDETPDVIRQFQSQDGRIRSVLNDRYPHSPAGARQRGVDEIQNELVAFLDSDDRWVPYHLSELVAALDANADIDWMFGDIRRLDPAGRVLVESKFMNEWTGRIQFAQETRGEIVVLGEHRLIENALQHDFNPGLQCSVIRRRVFERLLSQADCPPPCEDRILALEAAAAGIRFGFSTRRHLDYLIHGDNLSGANASGVLSQAVRVNRAVEQFWKSDIFGRIPATPERLAITRRRLADHLVWVLGNSVYRTAGKRWEALRCIGRGILLRPFVPAYWKTFVGTMVGIR